VNSFEAYIGRYGLGTGVAAGIQNEEV